MYGGGVKARTSFLGVPVRIECEICYDNNAPLEELLGVLKSLEKKLAKYPDVVGAVKGIGGFRIKLAGNITRAYNSYQQLLSHSLGIAHTDTKYIRLHTTREDVVLEEILHLAYPDKYEYEINAMVSEILGTKPREEKILETHVFAVDRRDALVYDSVYLIPREELGRLKRKRRGTTMAVTEEGEVIWLSKKDREKYWALMFLASDYLSPEAKEKARRRIIEAESRYIYKTDYGDLKRG